MSALSKEDDVFFFNNTNFILRREIKRKRQTGC